MLYEISLERKGTYRDQIIDSIARLNGNSTEPLKLAEGVYEIGHFSGDFLLHDFQVEEYPSITGLGSYGVCDNYQQILDKCPELVSSERKFVITLTPVVKANQDSQGGWRWHKWGEYIGTHTITEEYLYDEPAIDKVYVYHVYELFAVVYNTYQRDAIIQITNSESHTIDLPKDVGKG